MATAVEEQALLQEMYKELLMLYLCQVLVHLYLRFKPVCHLQSGMGGIGGGWGAVTCEII